MNTPKCITKIIDKKTKISEIVFGEIQMSIEEYETIFSISENDENPFKCVLEFKPKSTL